MAFRYTDVNTRSVWEKATGKFDAAGRTAKFWYDEDGTDPADIGLYDPDTPDTPGASTGGNQLTVQADSMWPAMWDLDGTQDHLWAQVGTAGSPGDLYRIFCDPDQRADLADARAATIGLLVSEQAGGTGLAKLQNAVTAAATFGTWAIIDGPSSVAGTVSVPTGARIDGSRGTVTQQSSLTPTFQVNNATDVIFRHVKAVGLGSDYVNASSVFAAAAAYVSGTSTKVRFEHCDFANFAGVGVRIAATTSGVRIIGGSIAGPGAARITPKTNNYGAGILGEDGSSDWSVFNCDISDTAQGINAGNITDVRISGCKIFNITGQHGIYVDAAKKLTITGNQISDTGLQGIKVQIANTTTGPDADEISITGNVVSNVGSHGLLLTKVVGGSRQLRRVTVTGNTFSTDGSGGDGINLLGVIGATIGNNVIYNARHGISATTCSGLIVGSNRINQVQWNGILATDVSDSDIFHNRIVDPASANNIAAEFGIYVSGTSSADLRIAGNTVTDSAGNMKYGLYLVAGISQATCVVRNNEFTGATDYGARLDNAQNIKEWANNLCVGTIGDIVGYPTTQTVKGAPFQFTATAAPTSGTWKRADVVWHRTPAANGVLGWVCVTAGTPGVWTAFGERQSLWGGPAGNSLLGAAFDPLFANTGAGTTTAGVLLLTRVLLERGGPITSVDYVLTGAGSGLTSGQNLIGVYSAAGAKLGESADQTTAFGSTGQKNAPLVTPTAGQDHGTYVYVAFLWNGSGSPQLRGLASAASFVNVGLVAASSRFATAGTSLTALPDTLPSLTASVQAPWFGLR